MIKNREEMSHEHRELSELLDKFEALPLEDLESDARAFADSNVSELKGAIAVLEWAMGWEDEDEG